MGLEQNLEALRFNPFFLCLLGFHVIGVTLLIINACYLKCTKGITSVRWEPNQCSFGLKRWCKMRNTVACNILIIFQLGLVFFEVLLIRYIMYQDVFYQFYLIVVACNVFIIITVYLPVAALTGSFKSSAYTGPFNAWDVYEFFNLIVLCFLISLQITAIQQDWSEQSKVMFVIAPAVLTYIVMVAGAVIGYSRFKVYSKLITKDEALDIINNSLEEPPYIQWSIRCTRQGSSES